MCWHGNEMDCKEKFNVEAQSNGENKLTPCSSPEGVFFVFW